MTDRTRALKDLIDEQTESVKKVNDQLGVRYFGCGRTAADSSSEVLRGTLGAALGVLVFLIGVCGLSKLGVSLPLAVVTPIGGIACAAAGASLAVLLSRSKRGKDLEVRQHEQSVQLAMEREANGARLASLRAIREEIECIPPSAPDEVKADMWRKYRVAWVGAGAENPGACSEPDGAEGRVAASTLAGRVEESDGRSNAPIEITVVASGYSSPDSLPDAQQCIASQEAS